MPGLLDGMSREEIRDLGVAELREREARRIQPMMFHNPLPWQKEEHSRGHPQSIRVIPGGNQSGKTTFAIFEMLCHMMQIYPDWWPLENRKDGKDGRWGPPLIGVQSGPDFDNWLEQTYLRKFYELLPEGMAEPIKNGGHIRGFSFRFFDPTSVPSLCNPNLRNTLYFNSYQQDSMAFEGKTFDIAGFDEPPPHKLWTATKRGLMARDGIAFFTMTPLIEPWVDSELCDQEDEDKNIHVRRVEIWENCADTGGHLRRDQIEAFLKTVPPEERLAREKGIFSHLAGVAYPEIGEAHMVEDFPIPWEWTRYEAIDPHGSRPSCIVFCAVNREGRRYYYNQLVVDGGPRELVQAIKAKRAEHGGNDPFWTVIDRKAAEEPSVVSGHRTSWKRELERAGLRNIKLSNSSPGSVGIGVRIVKKGLKPEYDTFEKREIPSILFFRGACGKIEVGRQGEKYGLIHQMRRVQWDDSSRHSIYEKSRTDKLKEVNRDHPDCLRYIEERIARQGRAYVEPTRRFQDSIRDSKASDIRRGIAQSTGY